MVWMTDNLEEMDELGRNFWITQSDGWMKANRMNDEGHEVTFQLRENWPIEG